MIFGNRKPFSMVQDADGGFGGAFFVGYHGGAGDADAVLCHTYTPSVIYEVRINGVALQRSDDQRGSARLLRRCRCLLVTGDRTTVEGVQAQMPWVRGVVVKESIGNFAADSMTPAAAQRAIRRERRGGRPPTPAGAKPFRFEPPLVLDVQLVTAAQAHLVATIPGFERTGSRSVRFVHDDYRGRLQSLRRDLAPRRTGVTSLGRLTVRLGRGARLLPKRGRCSAALLVAFDLEERRNETFSVGRR